MSLKRDPSPAAFWWACAIAAPPIAFAVAVAGFAMETTDPLRDVALIAFASIVEEIVFRGALQPALDRAFAGRLPGRWQAGVLTPANLVTSTVFAAFHLWRHPLVVAGRLAPPRLQPPAVRRLVVARPRTLSPPMCIRPPERPAATGAAAGWPRSAATRPRRRAPRPRSRSACRGRRVR